MNALERALAIERLRLAAAAQREDMRRHLEALAPACAVLDQVRAGVQWASRHPELVVAASALLAALSPRLRRFLWRWSKRGFFVWQFWRRRASGWILPSGGRHPAA